MTICAAIGYCKRTDRKLVIDWSDGVFAEKGENIFTKYFSVRNFSGLAAMEEVKGKLAGLSCYPAVFKQDIEKGGYDHFSYASNSFFSGIPRSLLFTEHLRMLRGFWQLNSRSAGHNTGTIWNFFTEAFYPENLPLGHDLDDSRTEDVLFYFDFTPNDLSRSFREHISLNKEMEDKTDSFSREKELGANTVGIHVRNTDKQPQKTLDALFGKLEKLNLTNPKYFLATDNKQVAEFLRSKLSPVIEFPKMMPDLKGEGMHLWAKYNDQLQHGERILEESIMDMWLLSMCEYLLYQGNSTFSILSKFMHREVLKTSPWDQ